MSELPIRGDPARPTPLEYLVKCLSPSNGYRWAGDNYKSTVLRLCDMQHCRHLLEIGGGRRPLLEQAEIRAEIHYTVNDISQRELDLGPDWVHKTCFDISGDKVPEATYDLIFSKMVLEHVKNGRRVYENIFKLLADGGICINFHPTLYSLPFLINYVLPDAASRWLLSIFLLPRSETEHLKFPAYYSWCLATERQRRMLLEVGYGDALIWPFYGHGYFRKIPVVRTIDNAIQQFAQRRDIRILSSYAYTIVMKKTNSAVRQK